MFGVWMGDWMNELMVVKQSNVFPIYPDGIPREVDERLTKVFGQKNPNQVLVANVFTGGISNLGVEREYLHTTLENTLAALYSMSPHQKHETFLGLSDSMKMIFDLYIEEKCKGNI